MRLLNNPTLVLTFMANDLEAGHEQTQTISQDNIVQEIRFTKQLINALKSSSDSVSLQLRRGCPAIEDIIATEGDIKAVLKENGTVLYTGYVSTEFSWEITDHGEQSLEITLESVGTRLLGQNYIDSGSAWLSDSASSIIYKIATKCGIVTNPQSLSVLQQSVSKEVESGKTCRELLDQLLYECNAVYYFNANGELCVRQITADTTGVPTVASDDLYVVNGQAISLSKKLRSYKGSRVSYTELASARDYLIYRDTTGQDATHEFCNHPLEAGHYYDGTEDYTSQEWSTATADEFREPSRIGAVNASSESEKVGSGKIVAISNLDPRYTVGAGSISVSFKHSGGSYFELTAHNTGYIDGYITRLDLYASVVYEKATSVIRTSIDGTTGNKSVLEEELEWIHDKTNAQRHANLLKDYWKSANASYSFHTSRNIELGSVIKLYDTIHTGLNVYVLVYASEWSDLENATKYYAVGISTFNLGESVYYGTTENAKPSGAQGAKGEPGESFTVEYALGLSPTDPPNSEGYWASDLGLWNNDAGVWGTSTWTEQSPATERGKYLWMRSRNGDGEWEYTRITTADTETTAVWLGLCDDIPLETPQGLPVMVGDYFVASVDFEDSRGIWYFEETPYICTAVGAYPVFEVMEFTAETSDKVLSCLNGIINGGMTVSSTSSFYGWFQNLAAQTAVINELFSQAITILTGGSISSTGYSEAEGNENGFKIDSSGRAVFANAKIVGDSFFGGNIICPSFSSMPKTPTGTTTLNISGSAQEQYSQLYTSDISSLVPCTHSTDSSVKFVKRTATGVNSRWEFYNSSMALVGNVNATTGAFGRYVYSSTWANSSFSLVYGTSSSVVFKLNGLGTTWDSLESGELYYEIDSRGTTGALHIKL